MLTRKQKTERVEIGKKILEESRNLVFIDFTGAKVGDLRILKKTLSDLGAKLKVIKKKLMRIVFEEQGIDFNPEQFESQVGIIFSDKELPDIASPVYKFAKEKEKQGFKILGAYDLSEKNFLDPEFVKMLGQLPSREILLGQLVGVIAAPIRMLMYVLNEKSKTVEK
jgi:large subunit ribosomal protein L10